MKKFGFSKYGPASLAGLFVLSLALSSCTKGEEEWKTLTVAKVDNKTLSSLDFAKRLSAKLHNYDALIANDTTIVGRAKEEVFQEFLVEVLTLNWSQENKIVIKPDDLNRELERVRGSYPNDIAFRKALAEEGLTYDRWLNKVKFTILQTMLSNSFDEKVEKPSKKELEDYYKKNKKHFSYKNQVKLRQIVLESEAEARRILKMLKQGRSLSALAKKYSIAPEANQEGLVGWVERGTLKVFDEAFNLPVGRLSDVKKSPYGFHIYQVVGKRPGRTLSFDQVKDKVEQEYIEKKKQAAFEDWIEAQLRKAKVYKNSEAITAIEVKTRD